MPLKIKKIRSNQYVFLTDLLRSRLSKNDLTNLSRAAKEWYVRNVLPLTIIKRSLQFSNKRKRSKVELGRMYHFRYDPKLKKSLPYYDKFPLVIPIHWKKNGFLGLNLHYIPQKLRAALLDQLYDVITNFRLDESTKIAATYGLLKGASRYKYFKPCLKHYLIDHVKTKFIEVEPEEWSLAIFLPTAQWEKASAGKVYKDSKAKVNG